MTNSKLSGDEVLRAADKGAAFRRWQEHPLAADSVKGRALPPMPWPADPVPDDCIPLAQPRTAGLTASGKPVEPVDPCRPWCTCGAWPHKTWCGYRNPSARDDDGS